MSDLQGLHTWGPGVAKATFSNATGEAPGTLMYMKPLDIGVDLDGVVHDFVGGLRHYLMETTGQDATCYPDAQVWNFAVEQWNMTLPEFLTACHEAVDAGVLFCVGDPYEDAVQVLQELHEAGHRLHIATDRGNFGSPGRAETLTRGWLNTHHVPYDSLTLTSDKTSILADVFLEDRVEFVHALQEAGTPVILFSRAYNQHADVHPEQIVTRWRDVPVALEHIWHTL